MRESPLDVTPSPGGRIKNPLQRVSWVLAPFPSPKSRPAPHLFYPCFHGTSNRLLDGLISPQFARVICIAGPRGKRTRPEWSQAKRTMRLDVLRAAKHWHQSARLMCHLGCRRALTSGQGDGDGGPPMAIAICADGALHVRCTCNNVPRPSQEAPPRKSQTPRSDSPRHNMHRGPSSAPVRRHGTMVSLTTAHPLATSEIALHRRGLHGLQSRRRDRAPTGM